MAFQVSSDKQEIFFFYADLKTNQLAFRSGEDKNCSISKVPDLFKIDLINYHNLWDYLFFLQDSGHWRLEWPVGKGFFDSLLSELHYLSRHHRSSKIDTFDILTKATKSEIHLKFGINELVLEEDSRSEEKIFFHRLETFKEDCLESEDLSDYLKQLGKEFSKQILSLIKDKFQALRHHFELKK